MVKQKMTNLDKLFEMVKRLNDILDGQLLEVSVKQHQITISVKEAILHFNHIKDLLLFSIHDDVSFISVNNDILYLTFGGLSVEEVDSTKPIFKTFINIISQFAEKVCTCPSLEFIISPQYLKCFLDKPGLGIKDLKEYENILDAKGKGELELHPQRPYLLFINEKYEG